MARTGLVPIGLASRHFEMLRFVLVGLAGGDVVTHACTNGAKHGGTQGDTLRRSPPVGSREGRAGTGEHGFSLTGGQVVAAQILSTRLSGITTANAPKNARPLQDQRSRRPTSAGK